MENMIAFLNMMQAVDAFFPIGAFTQSNGLETYVQQEKITEYGQLREYIDAYMYAFPHNDLGFMYLAYLGADSENQIIALDGICSAIKIAAEIRNGSRKMCLRFLKAETAMNENPEESTGLKQYFQLIRSGKADGFHPIALGIYAHDQKADIDFALSMYSYSVLSAIVNNAVKFVPLSQIVGQRILHESMEHIQQAVEKVKSMDINMLGISGTSYDIRCMQHEKIYSRLYMS